MISNGKTGTIWGMALNVGNGKSEQCPYGFATASFKSGNLAIAITGFVPYPRLGGPKESIVAKCHGEIKAATVAVQKASRDLLKRFFLSYYRNKP
jgi:hypothetical protein